MLSEKLTASEQKQADTILKQMGLNEADKYRDEIEYDLNTEYDNFKHLYENDNVVAKPEHVKRKEKADELARKGQVVKDGNLKPLKDTLIMKMDADREETTKSGIIIADLRPVKQDNPNGVVFALNPNTEYDFEVGDHIVIDIRYVKHRYNYNGATYLILNKDGVMGTYA